MPLRQANLIAPPLKLGELPIDHRAILRGRVCCALVLYQPFVIIQIEFDGLFGWFGFWEAFGELVCEGEQKAVTAGDALAAPHVVIGVQVLDLLAGEHHGTGDGV